MYFFPLLLLELRNWDPILFIFIYLVSSTRRAIVLGKRLLKYFNTSGPMLCMSKHKVRNVRVDKKDWLLNKSSTHLHLYNFTSILVFHQLCPQVYSWDPYGFTMAPPTFSLERLGQGWKTFTNICWICQSKAILHSKRGPNRIMHILTYLCVCECACVHTYEYEKITFLSSAWQLTLSTTFFLLSLIRPPDIPKYSRH